MPYRLSEELTIEQKITLNEILNKELDEYGVDESKVISCARNSCNTWNGYFRDNITLGKRDIKFLLRDQWDAKDRSEFNILGKPCLTFNTSSDIANKVIAEQRQSKPAMKVTSINGIASDEALDLRTDILRSISYRSDNDIVYQTAYASMIQFSYGAFYIYVDYESNKSFRKVIKYGLIDDPTTVFFDPNAKMPHKGDGDYCGRLIIMSKGEWDSTYPNIENPVSFAQPQILNTRTYKQKDTVVLCEYFQKEWFPTIIHELSDGRTVDDEEYKEIEKEYKSISKEMGNESSASVIINRDKPYILATRKSQDYRIMHYRLLNDMIVEVSEWHSKLLPIIFCPGNSSYIEGKQYTKSFISDAKDMQKFSNYVLSEVATEIKNRRREQWLGTKDNIIGQEQQWRNPEVSQSILLAKPDSKTNQMPMKLPSSEIPQSLLATLNFANNGIKEIVGYFQANVGVASDQASGKALNNIVTQGNLSSVIFADNMNQAIVQGGKVVLSLFPYVYGDERSIVLSNSAGESRSIVINKNNKDGTITNQIDEGEYDIEISSAPSFAVQKAQSLELFMKMITINPQILPLVADLMAKNLDIEDQHRLIKRFESLVPPNILAEEKGDEPPPPPPPSPQEQMMQQQMALSQKQIQEKEQELQIQQEELKIKHEKLELEKLKIKMEMMELQEKLKDHSHNRNAELHKADLDFTAKIANVVKDLHK